jgi:transcriptional regulator with XRE-family HTH domain
MNTQVQINDRLGELVRRARKRFGWSLEGFHTRLVAAGGPAPSKATLSRIERGFATFSVQEAACACRVLGISFHVLQQCLRIQRVGSCSAVPGDVILQRAQELYAIGAHDELLASLEAAYDRCWLGDGDRPTEADPVLRARLAHFLAFLHQRFENWDLARHFARVVLQTRDIDDAEILCAQASLMAADSLEGRWAEYVPRRIALESSIGRLEGRALAFVAMTIGAHERLRGAHASARRWLELALPIYAELQNLNTLRGRVTLAECMVHTGDARAGLDMIEDVRQEALARGFLHVAWFASNALANVRRSA